MAAPGRAPAVDRAAPADAGAIAALLRACDLPVAGACGVVDRFCLVSDDTGLAACAATEAYGGLVLLRSVAVRPDRRGSGLARRVTLAALERAAGEGATEAFLLTTTAPGFFRRFGFAAVPRETAPSALGASAELRGACPDTAILMRARLRQPVPWVRRAAAQDVPAITRIHNQGIEDEATLDTETQPESERAAWLGAHDARHPVLVAVAGARVRGWASLNPFSARDAYRHVADLSVYVEREMRGHGIGSLLLVDLVARAREIGLHKIVLTAFAFNEAGMTLYRRMGFVPVGVLHEQGMLGGRWVDTIMMERLL